MTTYHLNLTLSERGSGLHTTGGGPSTRVLASLDTEEPAVMAATLRAVADRLDPPKPPRPAYRRGDHMRAATGNAYDAQCRGNDCAEGHTYLAGCALEVESFAQQVTKRPHSAWACRNSGWPHEGTCDHPTPLAVDTPGDRMDAPDAVLSPAAAERVFVSREDLGLPPRRTMRSDRNPNA